MTTATALNHPDHLPPGMPTAWIVGAFEGGHDFGCDVLHPTGACMMRSQVLAGGRAIYTFCPVCRYVIVDAIDPSQHGRIDADYGRKKYVGP